VPRCMTAGAPSDGPVPMRVGYARALEAQTTVTGSQRHNRRASEPAHIRHDTTTREGVTS
jgi:hypothetical protein